jgi:riboflavin synthase
MIIAERKPMEEIKQLIAPYKKVLVAGCETCVAVCWAGGEKEVGILASQLRLARRAEGSEISVLEATVERQCD